MIEGLSAPKGIKKQIFGSCLFFLGALNTMLAIRGGWRVDWFYILLMAVGVFLFIYGGIQKRRRSQCSQ